MSTADEHRARIADFYAAFAARDGDAMAAHYAPGSTFRDPAFGDLSGEEAGDMWRMLTGRAEDLEIELAPGERLNGPHTVPRREAYVGRAEP